MDGSRLQPGDPAPELTLLDEHGRMTALSSFWPGGPTVLTFLRHFG